MPIQLSVDSTTGRLVFPAGAPIVAGGSKVVETHGVIAAMTDTALAAKFPETTGAQPDDVIWVGTAPENYVQWRMKQGESNAQLATSWELAPSSSATGAGLQVVSGSLTLNNGGLIEGDLPTELQTLAPFGDLSSVYLVQQNSGEWRLGAFAQFDFPAGNVNGLFFRASDPAITGPTLIWDNAENRGWVLEPDGNRYPMGGGEAVGKGSTLPTAQTPGNVYLYEDPNTEETDRKSRLFAKLHGAWVGVLMPFDFN